MLDHFCVATPPAGSTVGAGVAGCDVIPGVGVGVPDAATTVGNAISDGDAAMLSTGRGVAVAAQPPIRAATTARVANRRVLRIGPHATRLTRLSRALLAVEAPWSRH